MKKIGVIIGRFQVPELHAGHRYLVETVTSQCDHVLIILGYTEAPSERNPFSLEARTLLFQKTHPEARLEKIADHPSDEKWSRTLDEIITRHFPYDSVTLFGSRDSFLLTYTGRFKTAYISPVPAPSGTEIRKKFFTKKV